MINDALGDTITKLNMSAERSLDPGHPLTQIVKILNYQVRARVNRCVRAGVARASLRAWCPRR
jgi:hypothetical protein